MTPLPELLKNLEPERGALIRALQAVQTNEGYISNEAVESIARHCGVPPVEVEGVVSFYAQFKRIKPGRFKISVCDGTACHIKGATLVSGWITDELHIQPGETDAQGVFSLETVACLGCCSLAPVVSVNGKVYGNLDRKGLMRILRNYRKEAGPALEGVAPGRPGAGT